MLQNTIKKKLNLNFIFYEEKKILKYLGEEESKQFKVYKIL